MAATSQKRSGTTDLTVGKLLFQLLRFALPLVLGTLFQQLYSFADTVIVGRSLGGVLAVKTGLGYLGICLSNPFAWGLAMFYCLFMVCRILRRETQNQA